MIENFKFEYKKTELDMIILMLHNNTVLGKAILSLNSSRAALFFSDVDSYREVSKEENILFNLALDYAEAQKKSSIYIESLSVYADKRQGYGSILLNHITKLFKDEIIVLNASPLTNEITHTQLLNFYLKNDFKILFESSNGSTFVKYPVNLI